MKNKKEAKNTKIPKILYNRNFRIALYLFAVGGLITAGCWLTILIGGVLG